MPTFPSRPFRASSSAPTLAAAYRTSLAKHPFLLFGLPFIATMVAGSFFLTPATAIRYEKHDRKVRQLSKEEELGLKGGGRRVDLNEEYYRLAAKVSLLIELQKGRSGGWDEG
ncbi:Cytochrome oxidase assembly [Xylographa carneopallida]|nr:Cytochrome oxidase assembly [Xylographa carneopallida]